VVQARADIVAEYEQVCEGAGAAAGVVESHTFGLAQCALRTTAGLTGDWLLIHGAADGATIAIYRGRNPVFFRRPRADGDGHLGELVHQTANVLPGPLGGLGFGRVLAGGTAVLRADQRRLGWGSRGAWACARRWCRRAAARRSTPAWPTPFRPAFGLAASLRAEG